MNSEKLQFLTDESLHVINNFSGENKTGWGVMNTQEMIEHLADFYNVSAEKTKVKLYTPEEQLPAYKAFLLSDKLFRENTKAPVELIGEKPAPLKFSTLAEAKENLNNAVKDFVGYFKNNEAAKTLHPVFGHLNFDEWVLLHYKHVMHHLKQFGYERVLIV